MVALRERRRTDYHELATRAPVSNTPHWLKRKTLGGPAGGGGGAPEGEEDEPQGQENIAQHNITPLPQSPSEPPRKKGKKHSRGGSSREEGQAGKAGGLEAGETAEKPAKVSKRKKAKKAAAREQQSAAVESAPELSGDEGPEREAGREGGGKQLSRPAAAAPKAASAPAEPSTGTPPQGPAPPAEQGTGSREAAEGRGPKKGTKRRSAGDPAAAPAHDSGVQSAEPAGTHSRGQREGQVKGLGSLGRGALVAREPAGLAAEGPSAAQAGPLRDAPRGTASFADVMDQATSGWKELQEENLRLSQHYAEMKARLVRDAERRLADQRQEARESSAASQKLVAYYKREAERQAELLKEANIDALTSSVEKLLSENAKLQAGLTGAKREVLGLEEALAGARAEARAALRAAERPDAQEAAVQSTPGLAGGAAYPSPSGLTGQIAAAKRRAAAKSSQQQQQQEEEAGSLPVDEEREGPGAAGQLASTAAPTLAAPGSALRRAAREPLPEGSQEEGGQRTAAAGVSHATRDALAMCPEGMPILQEAGNSFCHTPGSEASCRVQCDTEDRPLVPYTPGGALTCTPGGCALARGLRTAPRGELSRFATPTALAPRSQLFRACPDEGAAARLPIVPAAPVGVPQGAAAPSPSRWREDGLRSPAVRVRLQVGVAPPEGAPEGAPEGPVPGQQESVGMSNHLERDPLGLPQGTAVAQSGDESGVANTPRPPVEPMDPIPEGVPGGEAGHSSREAAAPGGLTPGAAASHDLDPRAQEAFAWLAGFNAHPLRGGGFEYGHCATGFRFSLRPAEPLGDAAQGEESWHDDIAFVPLDLGTAAERLPDFLHGEIRFAAPQREKLLSIVTGALGSLVLHRARAAATAAAV